MNEKNIAKYLKQLRLSKKLTQAQLGAIINVSDKAISKWESGLGIPDIGNLKALAEFYNITVDAILGADTNYRIVEQPEFATSAPKAKVRKYDWLYLKSSMIILLIPFLTIGNILFSLTSYDNEIINIILIINAVFTLAFILSIMIPKIFKISGSKDTSMIFSVFNIVLIIIMIISSHDWFFRTYQMLLGTVWINLFLCNIKTKPEANTKLNIVASLFPIVGALAFIAISLLIKDHIASPISDLQICFQLGASLVILYSLNSLVKRHHKIYFVFLGLIVTVVYCVLIALQSDDFFNNHYGFYELKSFVYDKSFYYLALVLLPSVFIYDFIKTVLKGSIKVIIGRVYAACLIILFSIHIFYFFDALAVHIDLDFFGMIGRLVYRFVMIILLLLLAVDALHLKKEKNYEKI